jgi:hypothetical protein
MRGSALLILLVAGCSDDDAVEPVTIGAPGVTITGASLYQGVERVLDERPQPGVAEIPLIAGRAGLVRVFYQTDAAYDGREVDATLTLGGRDFTHHGTLYQASAPESLASTLTFEIPGDAIAGDLSLAVRVEQLGAAADDNAGARFARDGAELPELHAPHALEVVMVPLRYDADGSGRLPDTSPEQLERYRQMLFALYPVAEVRLSVHDPVPLAAPFTFAGISDALAVVVDLRAAEAPADNVYYYGLAVPTETRTELIGVGPTGLATTNAINDDPSLRAAVGIGYFGGDTYATMAHELGHLHGRAHAPCGGATGTDPAYPYPGGAIGISGYDAARGVLHGAEEAFDILGYCQPYWVSDYTYAAFDATIHLVESMVAQSRHTPYPLGGRWLRAIERPDGSLRWLAPIERMAPIERAAPSGDQPTRTVHIETSRGLHADAASWAPFDHVPGGILTFAARDDVQALVVDGERLPVSFTR